MESYQLQATTMIQIQENVVVCTVQLFLDEQGESCALESTCSVCHRFISPGFDCDPHFEADNGCKQCGKQVCHQCMLNSDVPPTACGQEPEYCSEKCVRLSWATTSCSGCEKYFHKPAQNCDCVKLFFCGWCGRSTCVACGERERCYVCRKPACRKDCRGFGFCDQ